ncbi:MAG: inositol monophosphatase [Patescibacteria group bacterium]
MKSEEMVAISMNIADLIFAASEIISYYNSKKMLKIQCKGGNPRDLVTDADKASEEFILGALKRDYPDWQIVGEEGSGEIISINPKIPTWLVDPLDGTTNSAKCIPLYAISIALWQNNNPLLGVVLEIPTKRAFAGTTGTKKLNAVLFDDETRLNLAVSQCENIRSASIAFDYPKLDERRRIIDNAIFNLMKKTDHTRELGSAVLALCYVAAGIFDGYINAQLYPWDVAAAKLFIEQAGGKVTNEKGEPWTFADRCIVASNGLIHDELVEEFQNAL